MRKLCWWAAPCSAAIFLAVYLLPGRFLLPAGVLCLLCALFSLLFHGNPRRRIALAALGLSFGFLWTGCYRLLVREPARALITEDPKPVSLVVSNFPSATAHGASFTAVLRDAELPATKIQLYAGKEALGFRPGDLVSGQIRLSASDFLRGESVDYYQARGIFLLGYTRGELSLDEHPAAPPFRFLPLYAAHTLRSLLIQVFPPDVSGFEAALITGDKSSLPPGLYAAFQRSGVSHVVAVSGLHISFLAGLFSVLFGRRSRLTAFLGIPILFFFAAAVGGTPSALRAAFMASLLLLAPLARREPDKPTTLSVALLALLLPCPYTAASISLQLSFGAVAGIYWVTGDLTAQWREFLPKWTGFLGSLCRRGLDFLLCNLAVTLGALLFTAPLAALYFGSVPLAGPLTNLLSLWAVSTSFLGGLLTALLGAVSLSIGSALARLIAWPARWILFAAGAISRFPFSSLPLLSEYLKLWFVIFYGILLLWFIGRRHIRPLLPAVSLTLTLSSALLTSLWPIVTSSLTVAALDVGEGSSTLLYSKGHAVLVDCGGNGGTDPGDIAADYLQFLGLSHLDALVLTHYHTDHTNGVPELLSRLHIPLLILPDVTPEDSLRQEILALAEQYRCKVYFLSQDSRFSFGQAELSLFAPLGDGGANEEGLSLVCTSGDSDVLITGDMNSIVERRLVKYKNLPDIELLLVGHHGSRNSTSEELLIATTPEAAVVSSGYNSYGHPAHEALERLGAAGCDVYLTDQMGTVTFIFD